jgi:hypothetical protein
MRSRWIALNWQHSVNAGHACDSIALGHTASWRQQVSRFRRWTMAYCRRALQGYNGGCDKELPDENLSDPAHRLCSLTTRVWRRYAA